VQHGAVFTHARLHALRGCALAYIGMHVLRFRSCTLMQCMCWHGACHELCWLQERLLLRATLQCTDWQGKRAVRSPATPTHLLEKSGLYSVDVCACLLACLNIVTPNFRCMLLLCVCVRYALATIQHAPFFVCSGCTVSGGLPTHVVAVTFIVSVTFARLTISAQGNDSVCVLECDCICDWLCLGNAWLHTQHLLWACVTP
jgi:hypothetical protein